MQNMRKGYLKKNKRLKDFIMIIYMILQEFYKKYDKFHIIYEIDFIQNFY